MKKDYLKDELNAQSYVWKSGEGKEIEINKSTIRFKLTSELSNDQLGIYELTLQPKTTGAQLHYHRFMDETFVVMEGEVRIHSIDSTQVLGKGDIAFFPKFTPHGFENETEQTARVLIIFNPAMKREGFFEGMAQQLNQSEVNAEEFLRLYEKYDSHPVNKAQLIPLQKD